MNRTLRAFVALIFTSCELLSVDLSSPVKQGQPVAEIDPTVHEATLGQAEGELASAKADLTLKPPPQNI